MKKYIGFTLVAMGLAMTSCNDYLDTLPDDRATVDTEQKAAYLLVDAYPAQSVDYMMEQSSDNVIDNGAQYTAQPNQEFMYHWQPITTTGNDDPYYVWGTHYSAVAAANQTIASLDEMGTDSENAKGIRAEALLCRAWAVFRLSNAFCMAYDPTKADTYLGLPYPKEAGTSVDSRGTLKELYENINADIEEALPMLNDSHITATKYHFNTKAAYAFAARFNLYYHNYDKAIEYASKVLGDVPSSVLRNYQALTTLAGVDDIDNAYIRSLENANLLEIAAYSLTGRASWASSFRRYASGRPVIVNELFWAVSPWGSGSSRNTLYQATMLYGNNQQIYFPKMQEHFEVTDKINQTGSVHVVDVVLTTDETLLVRAEAYALKGDFEKSVADINLWIGNHCAEKAGSVVRPVMTVESLNQFVSSIAYMPVIPTDNGNKSDRTFKKKLKPQGFTVAEGTQENFIQLILHMRRLETWQQGLRFYDLKRYGIEFSHNIDGGQAIIFRPGDSRGAIQLPEDVLSTGLEPNKYSDGDTSVPTVDGDVSERTTRYTE